MKFDGLSIIIPTKNRTRILEKTLTILGESISKISINHEIIIVNDGAQNSIRIPETYNLKIKIFQNPGNGVATARNFGVKQSNFLLLLFLDDDIWLTDQNILNIIDFHSKYDNAALNLAWEYPMELKQKARKTSLGRYLEEFGFDSYKGWNKNNLMWNDQVLFQTNLLTSQNLSIKKKEFNHSGGYDESFPYAGFEDHELSKKLNDKNIDIYVDPTSLCYHNEEDRIDLKSWLERKVRGSYSRRQAVSIGLSEVKLHYSFYKSTLFRALLYLKPMLLILAKKIASIPYLDRIYFKLVNVLLAVSIFEGYCIYGRRKRKG